MESKYAEFNDPRLVAVYNTVCPLDGYEKFYIELAKKLKSKTILDIGCGTGLLTCELAKEGFDMTGIEPYSRMLDVARNSQCGKNVQWVEGDALSLDKYNADLAIMTGHVAQFYIDDAYWQNALSKIHNSLRTGGYLAFESRNPSVQPWFTKKEHQDWHSPASPRKSIDPLAGQLETWSEPIKVEGERVTFKGHYLFKDSGEELITINQLVFRTKEEIMHSLEKAGFSLENVYGFWDWNLATAESPEFIFVAKKITV